MQNHGHLLGSENISANGLRIMLDKYEAQFQIDILQRLDIIIGLLRQLGASLPTTVILPDDSDSDTDVAGNSDWSKADSSLSLRFFDKKEG